MKVPVYFCAILVLFLCNACTKNHPMCWGKEKNEGIISKQLEMPFYVDITNNNVVINDQDAYKKMFSDSLAALYNVTWPEVDFTAYTLLGASVGGSCEIKVNREVVRSDNEQRYNYILKVKDCGICQKYNIRQEWVLVPKLPQGWNVNFKVK